MPKGIARLFTLAIVSALVAAAAGSGGPSRVSAADEGFNVLPLISDWVFVSADANPPSQAACAAVSRRGFNPLATAKSYDYPALPPPGDTGSGQTIAAAASLRA